jgi:hypothetical protein
MSDGSGQRGAGSGHEKTYKRLALALSSVFSSFRYMRCVVAYYCLGWLQSQRAAGAGCGPSCEVRFPLCGRTAGLLQGLPSSWHLLLLLFTCYFLSICRVCVSAAWYAVLASAGGVAWLHALHALTLLTFSCILPSHRPSPVCFPDLPFRLVVLRTGPRQTGASAGLTNHRWHRTR